MTGDELLARWEKLCVNKPDVSTGALIVELFGDIRDTIDREIFGAENIRVNAEFERKSNMRFSLALRGAQTSYGYLTTAECRLTEDELKEFASKNSLDYTRLLQVCLGERESYHGYAQGSFYPSTTYGRKFKRVDNDRLPGEDEAPKEKVGIRGLFRVAKVNEDE